MTSVYNLDDVAAFLVKRSDDVPITFCKLDLPQWILNRIAELRMREEEAIRSG